MAEYLRGPFFWALALAIAVPVISVTLAEVSFRLQRAGRPTFGSDLARKQRRGVTPALSAVV
jgi:hypothetical protein